MTDVINLNSIRSDNCDCNKPKPKALSCGCHNHNTTPCHQTVDLSDQYFKVKNLFSELKSEWQRTEARSNLGIVDIIGLELTGTSYESGGTNEWTMTTSKGGVQNEYKFYVRNGLAGKSATVAVGKVNHVDSEEPLRIWNTGTETDAVLNFNIPAGTPGAKGERGLSAYEIANQIREALGLEPFESEQKWLDSLRGPRGEKGESGKDGDELESIRLVSIMTTTKSLPDGTEYVGPVLVWEFKLKNNPNPFQMWIPMGGNGGNGGETPPEPSVVPCILYKKLHYDTRPTESLLEYARQLLLSEVNISQKGKSVEELELLDWNTYFSHVDEGDYVFMATSTRTSGEYSMWAITRLTAIPGANGTGSGVKGDFKSIAFTRTNIDISTAIPEGGTYNSPVPTSTRLGPNIAGITWRDGVPDGLELLWATTCIFHGDDTMTGWESPKRMTDTSTYDVEFCIKENYQGNPDDYPGNWFDPDTRMYKDGVNRFTGNFSEVIWRAEREIHNGQPGSWHILRVKGEKGDPGTGGGSGQGLVGATIRLRGTWEEDPLPCYINSSDQQPDANGFRFIDIVSYGGQYWMLRPEADNTDPRCNKGIPGDENDHYQSWVPASETDFAYINTLIADYLSVYAIDTSEVRIHSISAEGVVPAHNNIVAGMTSGKKADERELNNTGDTDNSIRIWAGSKIDTIGSNNYALNLESAAFKVRLNGKLEARNADIEGTVLANILRLGEDSFISGTNTNNSRILPKLENNKILMFYVLTDEMSSGTFTLSPDSGDKIKYLNASNNQFVTTTTSVPLKPKKLYLLFGIDHDLNESTDNHELIWHLVELNLASIEVTSGGKYVDPSFYDVDFYVELSDELHITNPANQSGILVPAGKVHLGFTNRFSSEVTVYIPPITLTLQYSQDGTDNTTYAYSINIENFSFTVGKSLSVSADAGYGTKSNSYTNHIGLSCTYEANEDLAGYQVGFEPKTLTETDFATFDLLNQSKINIKKAVVSATY